MKGDLTIQNDQYLQPLSLMADMLHQEGLRYALLGGGAVQVSLASTLSENGRHDFRKQKEISDHLRPTGDIDIHIDAQSDRLIQLFNELCYTYHQQTRRKTVYTPNLLKLGDVVVNPITSTSEHHGLGVEIEQILETAVERVLRAGAKKHFITTEAPEYIIAAKLTGNNIKPKDEFDIVRLATFLPIDCNRVKEILTKIKRPEAYETFERIMASYSRAELTT